MTNISQNMMDVLSHFTGEHKRIHGSELARLLSRPQKSVQRDLEKLLEIRIFLFEREGKNKLFYLNTRLPEYLHYMELAELCKALKFFSANRKICIALQQIYANYPCLIFGSYAAGTYTKKSDIDIVIFAPAQDFRSMPDNLHIQWSDFQEFSQKLRKADPLANEIRKNHIILSGFEPITRLFHGEDQMVPEKNDTIHPPE